MQQIEKRGKQHWKLPLPTVSYGIPSRSNREFKSLLLGTLGNPAMVNLLVKYGANTNDMLSNRWTPLLWAIEKNNEAVVRILIENGANVNAVGIEDKTPLHLAAERGYDSIAALLIQNGANVTHSFLYKFDATPFANKIMIFCNLE